MSEFAGDIISREAWEILESNPDAYLIDVRTDAEWNFVGVCDLSSIGKQALMVSWQRYPDMAVDQNFTDKIEAAIDDKNAPLFFLCRSGQRSKAAAIAMTAQNYGHCYNVVDGFEGQLDQASHRGTMSGWKHSGLPWAQR